jgi:hypothetical protein
MEVAAVLLLIIFGCIISFFISYFGFYRKTQSGRLFLSIITCLALGYISPWIIGGIGYIPTIISQYKIGSNTQKEIDYLASALAGKFSDREIKEHYLTVQLNGNDHQKIHSFLYTVTQSNPNGQLPGIRRKIKPETLPVLAEVFQKQSDILGLLAGYRDAPYTLKLKISDSIEPAAVKCPVSGHADRAGLPQIGRPGHWPGPRAEFSTLGNRLLTKNLRDIGLLPE